MSEHTFPPQIDETSTSRLVLYPPRLIAISQLITLTTRRQQRFSAGAPRLEANSLAAHHIYT